MAKKEMEEKKQSANNASKMNELLIENFVSLQKAITNLTIKFDSMADQISKLLQLFEISAKSFADKLATSVPEIEKDREFLQKLNALLEQNKVIAKGLTLMEEKLRERLYGGPQQRAPPAYNPETSSSQFKNYIPSQLERIKPKTQELS